LMDFFGNVQNVEVDKVANDTEWKEDLLSLGKKIAELRERSEAEERNATAAALPRINQPPISQPTRRIRAAKVEVDSSWWGKKAIGAWALAGCSLVWVLGTYLESA